MRNCKVVLESIDIEGDENLMSSVPKTRSRKKSTLTEENLAAFSPTAARRSTRASSTLSEETTSTKTSTALRRSTRRNSTAATTATATPKKELRTTRGASNSSEDVSVKSRSRRVVSPSEPRTPTAAKKRGTSRLSKKLETIVSVEEVPNIKAEQTLHEMSGEAESSQLQEPSIEDAYATPTGPSLSESSVICIDADSDEEIVSSMPATAIAVDQNPSIELMSTVTTSIAVSPNKVSLVSNSNATDGGSVRTKARPSISKWPKAKFRVEEEEPMDLSETINEENSSNKSGIVFERIAEIMASAAAVTAANHSVASADIFSTNLPNTEAVESSDTPNETVISDARESMNAREAVTPAKIASPLKNTSQLMSATLSTEQAASPKAKPRTLTKSLNIAQDEDDRDVDEVAETPDSTQNSPKMSPSKLMNAIVDRIASSEELVSTRPTPVIEIEAEPAVTSASSANKTANDANPETSAIISEVVASENPLEKEKSPTPLQEVADSTAHNLLAETDRWLNEFVEKQFNPSANTVNANSDKFMVRTPELPTPVVQQLPMTSKPIVDVRTAQTPEIAVEECVAQSPKVVRATQPPNVQTAIQTPKAVTEVRAVQPPNAEHFTQTPKTVVEERSVQTPKAVAEEHATQTPKSITQTRAVQTPTMDAEVERPRNVTTPRHDFDQSQKRRDTPYPDKNTQQNAADSSEIAVNETAAGKDLGGKQHFHRIYFEFLILIVFRAFERIA